MNPAPKSVLVAWCGHCGELGGVIPAEPPAGEERLVAPKCDVCWVRGRRKNTGKLRRCKWVLYALPVYGVCRECECTDLEPCPEGCGWADRTHTLCTSCADPPPPARDARAKQRAAKKLARARGRS